MTAVYYYSRFLNVCNEDSSCRLYTCRQYFRTKTPIDNKLKRWTRTKAKRGYFCRFLSEIIELFSLFSFYESRTRLIRRHTWKILSRSRLSSWIFKAGLRFSFVRCSRIVLRPRLMVSWRLTMYFACKLDTACNHHFGDISLAKTPNKVGLICCISLYVCIAMHTI